MVPRCSSDADRGSRVWVAQLNVYPGLKGLKELLGEVPSWISYEEKERVEVRVCQKPMSVFPMSKSNVLVSKQQFTSSHEASASRVGCVSLELSIVSTPTPDPADRQLSR